MLQAKRVPLALVLGLGSQAQAQDELTALKRMMALQQAQVNALEKKLAETNGEMAKLQARVEAFEEPSRLHTFRMEGKPDDFYPVFFPNNCWDKGQNELVIVRADVHTDAVWLGSLVARFQYHEGRWGNGSHYLEASVRQHKSESLADFKLPWYANGLVVWLRGKRTYNYWGNCTVEPKWSAANLESCLVTWSHPAYPDPTAASTYCKTDAVSDRVKSASEWKAYYD